MESAGKCASAMPIVARALPLRLSVCRGVAGDGGSCLIPGAEEWCGPVRHIVDIAVSCRSEW